MNTTPDPGELRQRVDELIAAESVLGFGQELTPALPMNWREGEAEALLVFVYRREAEPTSIVSYSVFSPTHRIEASIGDGDWDLAITALDSREVGTEGTSMGRLVAAEILEAEAAMVRIFTGNPAGDELATVRSVYARWVHENPDLVESLGEDIRSFLDWLD